MKISKNQKELLDEIFYSYDGNPGAFSTVKALYHESHSRDSKISYKIVKEYLKSIQPYNLHKRVLRRFKRRKLLSLYPFQVKSGQNHWCQLFKVLVARTYLKMATFKFFLFQVVCADLIFYLNDKSPQNESKSVCLNLIDTFSLKGFSRAIYDKSAKNVLSAFKSILQEAQMCPRFLFLDDGSGKNGLHYKLAIF